MLGLNARKRRNLYLNPVCPTFPPSTASTPPCSGSAVGLPGEVAEGRPNSLCSVWVAWVCALLSSDLGSLFKRKAGKKLHCQSQDTCRYPLHPPVSCATSIINVGKIGR